ncbi:hypothetical protein MXD59_17355 [Frankia sp. Ag45/Mut15]|uniref:Uncharacterized protein n=1 Tax=Frankia umida TaxID=573489 RepID=A0ABT0K2I8_9ACTN|nr:hypothetical protein [Frankia umida]MCK9877518.1 hypothetical protein [Frankia umida]
MSSTNLRVYGILGGTWLEFVDPDDIFSDIDEAGFYYTFDQEIQDDIGTSVPTDAVS